MPPRLAERGGVSRGGRDDGTRRRGRAPGVPTRADGGHRSAAQVLVALVGCRQIDSRHKGGSEGGSWRNVELSRSEKQTQCSLYSIEVPFPGQTSFSASSPRPRESLSRPAPLDRPRGDTRLLAVRSARSRCLENNVRASSRHNTNVSRSTFQLPFFRFLFLLVWRICDRARNQDIQGPRKLKTHAPAGRQPPYPAQGSVKTTYMHSMPIKHPRQKLKAILYCTCTSISFLPQGQTENWTM